MAFDTVPMNDLFCICSKLLDEKMLPIEYKDLTRMALNKLKLSEKQVNWFRQIEDVREKLPMRQDLNVIYFPKPHCLMAKESWFKNSQLPLFNADPPIVIPGNVSSGISGAYESLKRYPHFKEKSEFATEDMRQRACAKGLVIEHHVTDLFKKKWPGLIFPADNSKKWKVACNHDFKIIIGSNSFNVDVIGPNYRGEYKKPPFKRSTDLHLLCRRSPGGQDILWEGFITGEKFHNGRGSILPEISRSPKIMIVWLNCMANGLDYILLRNMVASYG